MKSSFNSKLHVTQSQIEKSLELSVGQSDYDYINQHNKIFRSGRYNFEGCKFPLKTNLNIDYFRFMLFEYEDEAICDFLEFGFPLSYFGGVQRWSKDFNSFVKKSWWCKKFSCTNAKIFIERKILRCNPRPIYM